MHPGPVGRWPLIRRNVRRWWKQHRLQLHVVDIVRQGPDDAGGARSAQIPAYCPLAQPQALGDRPLRQLARIPQPQNFSDLAHRQSLGWHPIPPLLGKGTSLPSVENCRRRRPLHPHFGLITITGTDDHDRPESVITFHRNAQELRRLRLSGLVSAVSISSPNWASPASSCASTKLTIPDFPK